MCSSEKQKTDVAPLGDFNLGMMSMITGGERIVLNAKVLEQNIAHIYLLLLWWDTIAFLGC